MIYLANSKLVYLQTAYLNLICNNFQDGAKLRLRINNTKWSRIGNLLTLIILPIMITGRGGSRTFSRGGGGRIFKKISKIFTTFFLGRPIDFSSSHKALFCPYFGKICCAAGKILKNSKKKSRFFGARSPSKNS